MPTCLLPLLTPLLAVAEPRVAVLDPAALVAARERLAAGDAALTPALARLRREADHALTEGPWSVMDKPRVPPSGDRHDYLSVGPYWWPDPTKPDGLPYIRRDGEVNPDRTSGATDEVALGRMADRTECLALAWYLTGHEPYAARAALLLRTWFLDPATRMNPHLNFGQAIPGLTTGRGIGIIDTMVLPRVCDAVGLLAGSPAWTTADQEGLVAWFRAYLTWLRTSPLALDEARQANNHGTYYDLQVVSYALFGGETAAAREVLEAARERRLASQIEPDGSQPRELARTKSFSYSAMNLKGFCDLAALGEKVGVDLWRYATPDGRSIQQAFEYLLPYADPRRPWPHPQLGDAHAAATLAPLLRRAERAYGEPRYAAALAQAAPRPDERWQLCWPAR